MKGALLVTVLLAAIAAGVASATGGPSLLHPRSLHKIAPAIYKVRFRTTKGPFVVKVHKSWAPKGANRFYNLAYYHFYDNQPLFRVVPGFVVQWGIHMKPAIAKAWQAATIQDDPNPLNNSQWRMTFATSGPNTRTTQVFVNLVGHGQSFGPAFAPFGEIIRGSSVFNKLYHGYGEGPSNNQGKMTQGGETWVRKWYPRLDWITTARLVP